MNILIVEDKNESRYMLESLLKGSGHEVVSAKNGVEALEKLEKDSIDMIISDILMPKKDGFALCRKCKSDNTLRKIPFVFYTATYTDKKDEEFALSLGAENFIVKPVEPEKFLEILEGVIKEHKKGALVAPKKPVGDVAVYLAEYNQRLIQKLEKKVLDLEREITERKRAEEALKKTAHDREERVKELKCLYELSRLVEKPNISLEGIFQGMVNLIPPSWQYPDITCARIVFEDKESKTDNFKITKGKQSADIMVQRKKTGVVEVYYLEEKPEIDEGTFLKEESSLIKAIAERLGRIAECKKAEEKLLDYQAQLKSLASELTLTEERERRRIAADLHDQISQSLVISKIKLDTLRSFVPSEDLAKELNEISDSLYQTIQDIRSLTFDLSFPILYELGFEAAVAAWLVEQIQEKYGIASEFEDDEQPKLLGDDVRVLLFRNMRELLINVVKHANANKVKVSIRKVGGEIHVRVEDDGVGFDVAKVVSTSAVAGGFGFFSIRERLEELGGHLEIDSEPGHGTKVTLMAPLKQQNTKVGQK